MLRNLVYANLVLTEASSPALYAGNFLHALSVRTRILNSRHGPDGCAGTLETRDIKNNEFHIWSVATVDDAIPIIMGKPFRDNDDEDSVINKIAQRIEKFERHEHSQGIVARIKNWFV